jgi:metallo-beta-lactamase family protein
MTVTPGDKKMTTLQFLGAAGCVTGSRFILESDVDRVLVDCGLFQGTKELRLRNWAPFPVPPSSLKHVTLTHAHLDHSGYLPKLVKEGFRGTIYATPATVDLCGVLLPDSVTFKRPTLVLQTRKGFRSTSRRCRFTRRWRRLRRSSF